MTTTLSQLDGTAGARRHFRYFDYMMAAFVAILLLSNLIGASKLATVHVPGFAAAFAWLPEIIRPASDYPIFGAGILFFPVSYVLGDVLTEVYGYANARRCVWTGFAALLFMAFMSYVVVAMPPSPDARVSYLADIENLNIDQAAPAARIVVNARTGSVVMNQAVTLGPCAVAHGNLSVTINSTPIISQPGAFSSGTTQVAEKADIQVRQDSGSLINMPAGTKLTDVVKALNALGATPQDLLAILQAMKAAGALNAELEVI